MATFEIQGADGKTYQVEAPDMESAAAAVSSFAPPAGGSAVNQENLGAFQSGANSTIRGGAQGLTLRTGDEILGGLGALNALRYGARPSEAYQTHRDGSREANSAAKEAHPGLYTTGEILGGATTSLVAAPSTLGKTALGTGLRSAGVGGVEGAIVGAGGADGREVIPESAKGMAIGAGLGTAAPALTSLARGAGRMVADPFRGMKPGASSTRANDVAGRALERSGKTVDDLQREITEAVRSGQPFTLADAMGQPGQATLNGVARTPGAGAREIKDFLQQRQLDAGDRMSVALSDALGAPDTAAQRASALTASRDAAADVNYPAARAGADPVDVRGALGVIDSRLGQTSDAAGTGFQGDSIDSVFSRYRDRLAADRVPDDIDAMELSDFDRVLGVKQDLGDDIGLALRQGQKNKARELGLVSQQLDQALEASSEGYRKANDTFAAQSRNIDAVDQGANAAMPRTRAADAVDQFSAMTPDQQSAFRAGTADRLVGKIENQATGANVASPLMRTRTATLLDEIAQDPSNLRGQIARENTMSETRDIAIGGSKTANNAADIMDVKNVDMGLIANLLAGNFTNAGTQLAQRGANMATGRNEATNQAIARILLSSDPKNALEGVLRQNTGRQSRQQIIEALLRSAGNKNLSGQ